MRDIQILAGTFLLYLASRLLPFFRFGHAGFGYDTGIYRRIIEEHFTHFTDSGNPSFAFASFSSPLRAIGVTLDQVLICWYLIFVALLFGLVYLLVKEYGNKNTAVLATFLLACSLVQFEFYTWFYYRQFLALVLLLATLILVRRRSYASLLPLIALGSIHPISFIPIGITLSVAGLIIKTERRFFLSLASISLPFVLLINAPEFSTYLSLITAHRGLATSGSGAGELTGQFLSFSAWLRLSIFILPLGLLGAYRFWKTQVFMTIFLLVSALLFASHVLFYRRFSVFLDIGLIFFAALYLNTLFEQTKNHWTGRVCAVIFFAILFVYAGTFAWAKQPIISPEELTIIQGIDQVVPSHHSIMVLSSQEAPWVYGYTHRPVIAPGLFEWNKWNETEWRVFWATEDASVRANLLNRYEESPLYIYVGPGQASFADMFTADPSFQQITPYIWSYSPAL